MTKRILRARNDTAHRSRSSARRGLVTALGGALALALALSGCGAPGEDPARYPADATPTELTAAPTAASSTAVAGTTADTGQLTPVTEGSLSAADAAGLLWMREEEKLARDIYRALADRWDLRVFANIARSEQSHMDALATLLDRYGLEDPVGANPAGAFSDPAIQALYDDLLARGSLSLIEALTVGATIEDLDIVDLRERKSTVPDIARVYANLELGSGNHLRAFVSNLGRRGASYVPAHLSEADFDAIIAAPRSQRQGNGH